jgi:hypothetical protein
MSRKPLAKRKLRFEALERRELLAVNALGPNNGVWTLVADANNDQVNICFDGTDKYYVDTDGNTGNNAEQSAQNVTDIVVILNKGATVTINSAEQGSDAGLNDAQFELAGDLTIRGSSGAKDTVTFKDDANKGSADIRGDLTFTGQGGGDEFTIEPPPAPTQSTWVWGDLTINTGNDATAAQVEIDTLVMKGGAGTSISLFTGGGGDTITLENIDTQGADLVLASDFAAHTPGGGDTVTLEGIEFGGGNVTVRSDAGNDVLAVDRILSAGDVLIDLGTEDDTLNIGINDPTISTADSLAIRGRGGSDTITVQNVTATGRLGIRTHKGKDRVFINNDVTSGSFVANMGGGAGDLLDFRGATNFAPGRFRARGGPGSNDKVKGAGNLTNAQIRRLHRSFERIK